MTTPAGISWTDLFSQKDDGILIDLRVIKRRGEPFLILPHDNELAVKSLSLYPAQTAFARAAKAFLKRALATALPLPLAVSRISLHVSPDDPFARFLMQLTEQTNTLPPFAILPGNPRAVGRRFIVLLFDKDGEPVVVVKAGISPEARELIQTESAFLREVAPKFPGLPKFCGTLDSGRVEALAMRYVQGESPKGEDRDAIGKLLSGWIDSSRTVRITDVPAWRALERALAENPAGHLIHKWGELAKFTFHPTLFHGDFAPWNIKVSSSDGAWMVLDWERGDRTGFPGWDWFHYVIQTAILVEKLDAKAVATRLNDLLADPPFRQYAELAGIKGWEKVLAVLYLSHLIHVIQPGEGIETDTKLLKLLLEKSIESV